MKNQPSVYGADIEVHRQVNASDLDPILEEYSQQIKDFAYYTHSQMNYQE